MTELDQLLSEIRGCQICKEHLPFAPKPVLRASSKAKVIIIGQAPGTRVQESGIPWDDPSGDRLRKWLDVDKDTFYNEDLFAIVPMGFCYPGKGKSGDLPPRKECAPAWHDKLWEQLPNLQLTLLIGQYAQQYYLGKDKKATLTETVMAFEEYAPKFIPTVHPSPRNVFWMKKNPWFDRDLVPYMRKLVHELI